MEDRKTLILKKAMGLFKLFGFKRTTMTQIADSVGLNKASLYHYFRNKEDLFAEILEREGCQNTKMIREALKAYDRVRDKFIKVFEFMIAHHEQHELLTVTSMDDWVKIFPRIKDRLAQVFERNRLFVEELLREGISRGEFIIDDVPFVSETIMSFLRVTMGGMIFEEDPRWAEKMRLILGYILDGLARGDAARREDV